MMKMQSLLPLYFVVFGLVVGFSMVLTVLNIAVLSGGGTFFHKTILLGSLLAMYPLGQFVMGPIWGALSDHYGRRPIVLVILGGCIFGFVCTAIAFTFRWIPFLYVSLLLTGGCDSTLILAQSAVADVSTNKERATLFGYLYGILAFAWIFGPLIAGVLMQIGLAIPFWVAAALLATLFFWIWIGFKETFIFEPKHKLELKRPLSTFFEIFTDKSLCKFYLVNALLYLAMYSFYRTYPMIVVEAFHFDVDMLDELISFLAFPIIFANTLVIKPLSKKFSSIKITFIFSLLITASLLIILFPKTTLSVWITLALTTFVMAVVLTASSALISEYTPSQFQGKAMGNNLSLFFLTEAISAALGGILVGWHLFLPIVLSAALALLAALLLLPHLKVQ